jgi:hypothetical protein
MTWSQGPFVCRYVRNELTCERERHGFASGGKSWWRTEEPRPHSNRDAS